MYDYLVCTTKHLAAKEPHISPMELVEPKTELTFREYQDYINYVDINSTLMAYVYLYLLDVLGNVLLRSY